MIGPDDPEFLIELSGLEGLFEAGQNSDAIFRVKQFLVRRGIVAKRFVGAACYGLKRWVDIDNVPGRNVDHPENLENVSSHLPKAFVAFPQSSLVLELLRNVAQNSDMATGQIVRLHGVFNEYGLARSPDQLHFAVARFPASKTPPCVFVRVRKEGTDRVPEKLWASGSKKGNRRGVRFEANAPVVDDQNGVQRTIEDGLEFTLRRVECAGGLALLTSSQGQETGMKRDRHC
jgi:hypothetical protein